MISYSIGDRLYLNVTNRCPNDCVFCIKKTAPQSELWLSEEPELTDVKEAISGAGDCSEIVFCGFGEPLLRPDIVSAAANHADGLGYEVRVNTNGLAELVLGEMILPRLKPAVSTISVSLVAADAKTYAAITRCPYGEQGYVEVRSFIERCREYGFGIELSVVKWRDVDIDKCRAIAEQAGADFRIRGYARGFSP